MPDKQDTLSAFVDPAQTAEPKWEPPPWPEDCPEPGFYPGIPFDEYLSWPAINSSALKLGYQVSPKHMKAVIDGDLIVDSRAMKFGRAMHLRLLEPKDYKSLLIASPCNAIIASGKREGEPCGKTGRFVDEDTGEWVCGTHHTKNDDLVEPKEYVTEEESGRIETIAREVVAHPVVNLLRQHGGSEVSIVWSEDGLPAKARLDKLIIDAACPDTVLDLKKGRPCKLTDDALQRSIREYFLDGQAWWYSHGVHVLRPDKTPPLWAWCFMEDGPPFDIRPIWASAAMLEVGRCKISRALQSYRWCLQTGEWPGYASDIQELSPSDWERKQFGIGG